MDFPRNGLLTPSEAAFYLARRDVSVTAETLRRLADSGKLAVHRTPTGRRLFARDALDRLAAKRTAVRP